MVKAVGESSYNLWKSSALSQLAGHPWDYRIPVYDGYFTTLQIAGN